MRFRKFINLIIFRHTRERVNISLKDTRAYNLTRAICSCHRYYISYMDGYSTWNARVLLIPHIKYYV